MWGRGFAGYGPRVRGYAHPGLYCDALPGLRVPCLSALEGRRNKAQGERTREPWDNNREPWDNNPRTLDKAYAFFAAS